MAEHFVVFTIGRVGVDLYPLQDNVGLEDVDTFSKSVGGELWTVPHRKAELPSLGRARGRPTCSTRRPAG